MGNTNNRPHGKVVFRIWNSIASLHPPELFKKFYDCVLSLFVVLFTRLIGPSIRTFPLPLISLITVPLGLRIYLVSFLSLISFPQLIQKWN